MTHEPDQEGRQTPGSDSLISSEWALPFSAPAVGLALQPDQAVDESSPMPPAPGKKAFAVKAKLPALALLWTGAVFGMYMWKPETWVSGLLLWLIGLILAAMLVRDLRAEITSRDLTLKETRERADQMERRVDKRSASLQLRQRQLQALIDNVRPGAYIKNIHHEFVMVNARLCTLFKTPVERLLGSDGQGSIQAGVALKIAELEQKVLFEREPLEIYDLFDQTGLPDGGIITLTIFPVIGPDGVPVGTGGLLRDVTNNYHLERELIRTREEARKAALAKSSFLANISHEFRTPLNGIIGMAELLARSELTADQAAMAAVIINAGDTLMGALNDVLDLSKIENGKLQLNARPFSLRELVFDVLKGLAPIAHSKRLELIVNIAPQLPDELYGDDARLRQILLNLVSNSLKFTNEGEVRVTVGPQEPSGIPTQALNYEPESESRPACRFRLSVSDTGIGIPEDKRKIIFEAFEQADGSSTRSYGGSGLGLAISYRLADLMNSRLKLVSAEGRGSTFWLDLALPVISEAGPTRSRSVADSLRGRGLICVDVNEDAPGVWERFDSVTLAAGLTAEAGLVSSRRLNILLAEDMEVNQVVARRMLEELGHQVTVAANGAEALNLFREKTFDLILMDIQMPVIDGLSAAAQIRELELEQRRPHTPVVAMTAHALQGDREKYLAKGMDAYQSKPLMISELAKMLEDMIVRWNIEGRPGTEPTGPPPEPSEDSALLPRPEPDSAVISPARQMIDFEVTRLSFGGNQELLRKSMELYLRDAPVVLDKISAALEEDQPEEAAAQAHALKGISGYYTKEAPYLLAMELDKQSREAAWPEDRPGLKRLTAELRTAVETLMAEMRSYLSYEDC